ncbi:unnamed protein product [Prunus armeniaca]
MSVLENKSPIQKVRGLESTTESDHEYVPSKTQGSTYHSTMPTRYSKAKISSPPRHSEDYGFEEIPSRDPVIRLLFQKVQKMENDRTHSQEPDWGKLRPGPFTELIRHSRQDRDVQPLRIPFYTEVEESALKNYSTQEPSYPPNERKDQYAVDHKRKDNHDARQGHSKKGKGKYGGNDHQVPLPNHDRSQEVFTLLNITYEAVLMNEQEIIPKPVNRKPNR